MPLEGGKKVIFWLHSRLVSLYPLPLPFQSLGCILGKNPPPHTTLAFIIFFTVRYYWFQKAISTYDSVMLGRMVLCVFRSFSGLCTQASKCLCSFLCMFYWASFSIVGYLSWLKVFILTRAPTWFDPTPWLLPFLCRFLSAFSPFLSSSIPSTTALPTSDDQDLG